jgi:hypothetical protein
METSLSLKYTGPAVDDGRMDVYAASANMIAFSEFVVIATKATFGEQASARAEVAGFGRGSFVTNLLFSLSGEAASIFSGVPAAQLLSVIKEAFALWKHLKGQPAKAISYAEQHAVVTNNDGQIIQVQTQSLTLVMSEKGSEAADRFVRQALAGPGMEGIALDSQSGRIAEASQAESRYFVPVVGSETVTDNIMRMGLVVESPSFKDGNKWKVFDGSQSIYVDMLDQDFIARINGGARFGKGDVLMAEVRLVQRRAGMKLEAERSILKVLEHKQGPSQPPLL